MVTIQDLEGIFGKIILLLSLEKGFTKRKNQQLEFVKYRKFISNLPRSDDNDEMYLTRIS